ncbi:MAG: hypothetical protein ACRCZ5_04535, partial [Burkholderiales bacterium]
MAVIARLCRLIPSLSTLLSTEIVHRLAESRAWPGRCGRARQGRLHQINAVCFMTAPKSGVILVRVMAGDW